MRRAPREHSHADHRGRIITPREPAPTRWLQGLAWASLACAVVALMLPCKIFNQGIWLHLAVGHYILAHGWVPSVDPFGVATAGRAFVAHEWLAEVIFYLVHDAGGVVGLTVFKFLLASATYTLVHLTAQRLGARLSVILPPCGVLLYIATPALWSGHTSSPSWE